MNAAREHRPTAAQFSSALHALANHQHAAILQRFFKTGKGQYAEGDMFIGVKVPPIRKLVREFSAMPPAEAAKLVRSPVHEERLGGLLLWVHAFARGDTATRERIFALYLANTRYINNWDLVDLSAPQIVGGSLPPEDTTFLRALAESPLLWERRIAMLATFTYIRQGTFGPTLELCELLLGDRHDLMHKACGWMLREVDKRHRQTLAPFLQQRAAAMPRTMLRYAIEHFDLAERRRFMSIGRPVRLSKPARSTP